MAKRSQPAGSISDTSDTAYSLALSIIETLCGLNNGVQPTGFVWAGIELWLVEFVMSDNFLTSGLPQNCKNWVKHKGHTTTDSGYQAFLYSSNIFLEYSLVALNSLSFSQSNSLSPFLFLTVNKSDKKHENVINMVGILGWESHVWVQQKNRFVSVLVAADLIVFSYYMSTDIENAYDKNNHSPGFILSNLYKVLSPTHTLSHTQTRSSFYSMKQRYRSASRKAGRLHLVIQKVRERCTVETQKRGRIPIRAANAFLKYI